MCSFSVTVALRGSIIHIPCLSQVRALVFRMLGKSPQPSSTAKSAMGAIETESRPDGGVAAPSAVGEGNSLAPTAIAAGNDSAFSLNPLRVHLQAAAAPASESSDSTSNSQQLCTAVNPILSRRTSKNVVAGPVSA